MSNNLMEKYRNMPLPAKSALWFTLCNLVLKGISFVSAPIFARIIPENEYGILSVFFSYEQLVLILTTWEIQLGAYQKGIFKYRDDVGRYTMATLGLVNLLTLAGFLVVFALRGPVCEITGFTEGILIHLFGYMILQPAYSCWLARKRMAYEYKKASAVTLLYGIANVAVPMAAVFMLGKTADIKFSATLIISNLICLFFYLPYTAYWKLAKSWHRVREYWNFSIRFQGPLVLHALSYLVLGQADRIMIGQMVGDTQAAYYSVAYNLANVISIFQISLNQALLPWRYEMLEKKRYSELRKVTNYTLAGMGMLVTAFTVAAPEALKILFSESYYEAVWCIPPIAAGIYFMFVYTVFVNVETYFEKTKYVTLVSVFCGIVNIVMNAVCIHIFGYIACGYTTLISYILFAAGHYIFMKKTVRETIPGVNIFDLKFIVLFSAGFTAASVCITLLYPFVWGRYALIFVMAAVLFVMRKNIRNSLVRLKR